MSTKKEPALGTRNRERRRAKQKTRRRVRFGVGTDAEMLVVDAVFALHRGDPSRAARSARRCLEENPRNEFGLLVLESLRRGPVVTPSR